MAKFGLPNEDRVMNLRQQLVLFVRRGRAQPPPLPLTITERSRCARVTCAGFLNNCASGTLILMEKLTLNSSSKDLLSLKMAIKCQKRLCYMPCPNCNAALHYCGAEITAITGKFLEDFYTCYRPADYMLRLEEEIGHRKQKPDERGREFIIELQTLMRRHGNM